MFKKKYSAPNWKKPGGTVLGTFHTARTQQSSGSRHGIPSLVPLVHVLESASSELQELIEYTSFSLGFIQVPHPDSQNSSNSFLACHSFPIMLQGVGSREISEISHVPCQSQSFHTNSQALSVKAKFKGLASYTFHQGKCMSGALLLLLANAT